MKDVTIIGGGPAGIGAAEALIQLGKSVTLLDISPFTGGVPIELSCKGDTECTRCHVCMPRDAADRIRDSGSLEVVSMAKVVSAAMGETGIEIQAEMKPRYVLERKCIECGKCIAVCPVPGAIVPPPHGALPNVPYIDREICAHYTKQKCDLCAKVCPTDAIRYRGKTNRVSLNSRALIVATGMEPIFPGGAQHYSYGLLPNVVTSLEAERIIVQQGELKRPSDGKKPSSIAIVQCAGSRTTKGGVEYCSKFCCKYALRIARAIVERFPDTELKFLYMDLRSFEPREKAIAWAKGRKNVKVIQGVPGFIQPSGDGNLMVRRVSAFGKNIEEDQVDMVILSVGGHPRPETRVLAELLSLEQDGEGFLIGDSKDRQIFVAGSCREPMDIEESYIDGRAKAFEAAKALGVKP